MVVLDGHVEDVEDWRRQSGQMPCEFEASDS